MGMFDNVEYVCDCPNCGGLVQGFQSKDGPCEMKVLKPADVGYMYTSCENCQTWIAITTTRQITAVLTGMTILHPVARQEVAMPEIEANIAKAEAMRARGELKVCVPSED